MMVGQLVTNPVAWFGAIWCTFIHCPAFRAELWQLDFRMWRELLLKIWVFSQHHPYLFWLCFAEGVAVALIRYSTSFYAYNDDYLFVQTGLLNFRAPGGPFVLFTDPIPFATVQDANRSLDLLGLITGDSLSSESPPPP